VVSKIIQSKYGEFNVRVDDEDANFLEGNVSIAAQREKSGLIILVPVISKNGFNRNNSDKRFLHLMIIEKILQRKLNKSEVVHHLDGDRFNDIRQNFLVTRHNLHAKLHTSMSQVFAKDHFQSPLDDEKIQLLHELLSRNTQVTLGVRIAL